MPAVRWNTADDRALEKAVMRARILLIIGVKAGVALALRRRVRTALCLSGVLGLCHLPRRNDARLALWKVGSRTRSAGRRRRYSCKAYDDARASLSFV